MGRGVIGSMMSDAYCTYVRNDRKVSPDLGIWPTASIWVE